MAEENNLEEASLAPESPPEAVISEDSSEDIISLDSQPFDSPPSEEEDRSGVLPFLMVGIGSSAGGVEAYSDLFQNLAPDTGMAFVLVPHLAPREKSYLQEILERKTTMPVSVIAEGLRPEPNHVYILAPNALASIQGGVFHTATRPEAGFVHPIDLFFRSLAADQRSHAVGVVLSGMDSDGALGLKTIKGEGGISIVQEPESARFPSMPLSAIAADGVDLIVPPAKIAWELARIGEQFQTLNAVQIESARPTQSEERSLTKIFKMLRKVSGINFADYKLGTMRRRLARRLILKHIPNVQDYATFLDSHPDEIRSLNDDMLVNVTRFFRDPEIFDVLTEEIFPRIMRNRSPDDPIRIWIAGCSTGEEVYSVGICLLEYLSKQGIVEPPIQLFGTDASEACVAKARAGSYPDTLVGELSPERLRRYFVKAERDYLVCKRLRDICVFARHNVCGDPPFSRLDMVSCRNVLIYLSPRAQQQVVPTFHYALKPNGYLLLGTSETIRDFTDLFTLIDRAAKIYAKVPGPSSIRLDLANSLYSVNPPAALTAATPPDVWSEIDLQRAAERIILSRFGPPGVVVNENWNIVLTRGHTAPFFEMSPGVASLNLLRMLRESVAEIVRSCVRRAFELDQPVQESGLRVPYQDRTHQIRLEVLPIPTPNKRSRYCLLLFVDETLPENALPAASAFTVPVEADEIALHSAAQLREDLNSTKAYLQSLIEERDAKNQELVSANEEIQSANEELQSTNEELETTKEEIQSANEELQTVNDELQQRNAILTQTGNDLTNLLNSVNLPVLMLNNDLQIRQFTPPTQRIMSLRPSDIGRPVGEIRSQLSIENLEPLLREVIETLATKEVEVQDREGRWHMMRIRPYRTGDNKIEGAVMVLIDIEDSRRAQQVLRDSRDFARGVIEGVPMPLLVLGLDLRIRSANSAFRELSALQPGDLDDRSFPELAASLWKMESIRERLSELREGPPGANFHIEHATDGPQLRVLSLRGLVLQTDGEKTLMLVMEDITFRRRGEEVTLEEKAILEGKVRSTQKILGQTQREQRRLAAKHFHSQEEERRRVARELHDDITQKLALLEIQMDQVLQSADGASQLKDKIAPIRDSVGKLSDDVRNISHRLHPAILESLGLAAALKNLTEEFGQREGMLATFHSGEVRSPIPQDAATCLYRIAQEALRNVAKHAGKTHVKVSLDGIEKGVRLEVRDFGIGFDTAESEFGLGLVSIVERARLVDGLVSVESALGRGASVTVDVPLPLGDS